MSNLSRHIIEHHLELGQLWRCPVEWCLVWKGTAQDCMDNVCGKHNAAKLVELKMLGKFFSPWIVSWETWCVALHLSLSGVATDVKLFHQYGRRLVHRYWIYKDPLSHVALQGSVIRQLSAFVNQAMTVARLASLHLSICRPGRHPHRTDWIVYRLLWFCCACLRFPQ